MCKDFGKSLKENIFTIILCIINLVFGIVSYAYANDLKKVPLITLTEKISIVLITIFAVFKVRCSWKKKEQEIIEKGSLNDIHSKQNEIGKMEKTEIQIIKERDTDNGKMIPFDIIDKIRKSICKISYENNNGTGFFILLKNSFKCIMTNYHVISEINNIINIQINNNKNININLNNRNIKY